MKQLVKTIIGWITGWSFKIWLILGGAFTILSVVVLAYIHYNGLIKELQEVKVENSALTTANEIQANTINYQTGVIGDWKAANRDLLQTIETQAEVNRIASENLRRLNDTLARHDLNNLSLKKPGLIQTRINRATNNSLLMLECASGSTDSRCPSRQTENSRSTTKPKSDSNLPN